MTAQLTPFFEDVQGTYDRDHTTGFLRLFLDPTLLYSCAYFEREDMTLEEAQIAKLDLALGKIDLHPGQRMLDIGCGWGASSFRAAEKYRVDVTALTLCETQLAFCRKKMKGLPEGAGTVEIRLQGWEEFDEPVDRINCLAAFEHFRRERYADFFARTFRLLPNGGRMLLHTNVTVAWFKMQEQGLTLTHEDILFARFMRKEVFPGCQIVDPQTIVDHAEAAGYRVERVHSLADHYARTMDLWAANLESHREEAIAMKSQQDYDRYMKYLVGSAKYYRSGHMGLNHFTLVK